MFDKSSSPDKPALHRKNIGASASVLRFGHEEWGEGVRPETPQGSGLERGRFTGPVVGNAVGTGLSIDTETKGWA